MKIDLRHTARSINLLFLQLLNQPQSGLGSNDPWASLRPHGCATQSVTVKLYRTKDGNWYDIEGANILTEKKILRMQKLAIDAKNRSNFTEQDQLPNSTNPYEKRFKQTVFEDTG